MSCATTPDLGSFDKMVFNGMDKDQVLNEVGTPQLTKRRNGMDIWQFSFYQGENKTIKEVHFKDGKVVYRGASILPKSNETAKSIDERNARSNAAQSASGASIVDSESASSKINRMNQELEAELPNKKPEYQDLE